MPAFQQIYSSLATIKGNIAAFESMEQDLQGLLQNNLLNKNKLQKNLYFKSKIVLDKIKFNYPNKKSILKEISLSIKANTVIGIVGPTGSGKSTLVDILIGLIEPSEGELIVMNTIINKKILLLAKKYWLCWAKYFSIPKLHCRKCCFWNICR